LRPSAGCRTGRAFSGPPAPGAQDFPGNTAPIQKFMWWDARLEGLVGDQPIQYEISAVVGNAGNLTLIFPR
jgi:hypothetical protein